MRLADLKPTGRVTRGPASDLIELVSTTGHLYTGIQFHPEYVDHPRLRGAQELRRFLDAPTVPGITELDIYDQATATFVYPTGQVWCLAELLELVRGMRPFGPRAGFELLWLCTRMLDAASRIGESHGVWAHGNLDPWRVMLEDDGDVQIIGYGLVAPELVDAPRSARPTADSYRYAPPERFRGDDEDVFSDLFSAALVAAELVTGEPVYDGDAEHARADAERARGANQLHRWRDDFTRPMREVLQPCIAPYHDERYDDPQDLADKLRWLLEEPLAGATLTELMADVSASWKRDEPIPTAAVASEKPPQESTLRWSQVRRRAAPERKREQAERRERRADPISSEHRLTGRRRPTRPALRPPADANAMFPKRPPRGEAERYLVAVGDDDPRWVKLSPDESLAQSAARCIDKLCATPIDLSGELMGWYRLTQDGDGWYGDAKTRSLDPAQTVNLEFFDNELVNVTFVIHRGDEVERDDALVGTAVHAQFMMSRLAHNHGLRERDWRLYVEGHELDRFQVLDDFGAQDGLEIEVMRRSRR